LFFRELLLLSNRYFKPKVNRDKPVIPNFNLASKFPMKKNFFDVPRTLVTTSHTITQVPIFFYASACRIINYFIDREIVQEMLDGTGLMPISFFRNKAFFSLAFFNYHQGSMEDYQEVILATMAYPERLKSPSFPFSRLLLTQKARNMANYSIDMPVSTMASLAAGREIWGFPKFITRIPYRLSGDQFEFSVLDPDTDEFIVNVKGEMGIGFQGPAFDFTLFYNYKDTISRAEVEVGSKLKYSTCKKIQVEVGSSQHRMSENIRKLGLQTAQPFSIISSNYLRTLSNPGKPIIHWQPVPLPYQYDQESKFYQELYGILGESKE
jgi:hypothetical protein